MKSTIHGHGGAVVSVPAFATQAAPFAAGPVRAAGVAASHLAVSVRLNSVGASGVDLGGVDLGRGMWRGQPSFVSVPAAIVTATAPAAPATNARINTLDRVNKLDRNATKQFRTTVYEGPRPWKVPV